jgi:hypothetical protein
VLGYREMVISNMNRSHHLTKFFSTIQITYGSVLAWALQEVPQPLDG